MGALLPTLQAQHLREGLTDYLATTFALTDPDAQSALTDFVGDPDTGMFKGPVRPAAASVRAGRRGLDRAPGLVAAGLHARTAIRHSRSRSCRPNCGDRPQPTLVTTGTGSGKTEAFLYPDPRSRPARAGSPVSRG